MAKKPFNLNSLLVSKPDYRQGRLCLRGTGLTVHQIAAAHMMGYTVDDLWQENPHLDRSLFYAALAYYYANREQIEAEIDEDRIEGERLMAKYPHGIGPETPRPW